MGRIFTGETITSPESQEIVQQPPQERSIANRFGGFVGTLGRFLNIGTDVQVGVTEKALEGLGVITRGEDTAFRGVGQLSSNIDLLKRIGRERFEENSLGGFFTGKYTPSTSVFSNFIKEVPVVSLGLGADIFLDPSLVLGKVGAIGKITGLIGKEIQKTAGLLNQIPAVEKVGNVLGNLFITRFGQRAEFQTLDKTRLIQESLSRKEITKLVSPVIEKPAAIQRRISQIIQGTDLGDKELQAIAKPIRQELDRVGEVISKINPKLLSEETFAINKGTYFPRLYKKFEIDDERIVESFFKGGAVKIPSARFKKTYSYRG